MSLHEKPWRVAKMLLSTQCVRPVNQSVHVLLIGPGTSHKIYHGDTCSSLLHVVLKFEEDRMKKPWTMIHRIYCSVFLSAAVDIFPANSWSFTPDQLIAVEWRERFLESLVRSKDLSTAPTMVAVLQPHCYWWWFVYPRLRYRPLYNPRQCHGSPSEAFGVNRALSKVGGQKGMWSDWVDPGISRTDWSQDRLCFYKACHVSCVSCGLCIANFRRQGEKLRRRGYNVSSIFLHIDRWLTDGWQMVILGPMMTILEGNLQQGTMPTFQRPVSFPRGL